MRGGEGRKARGAAIEVKGMKNRVFGRVRVAGTQGSIDREVQGRRGTKGRAREKRGFDTVNCGGDLRGSVTVSFSEGCVRVSKP